MKTTMSTLITVLLATTLLADAGHARGHESGNGGGGMVCRKNGALEVELLDYWEAEALKGLKIQRGSSIPALLQRGVNNLIAMNPGTEMSSWVRIDSLDLFDRVQRLGDRWVQPGVGIEPPRDALHKYKKKGCDVEGVALYDDLHRSIEVDRELYESMSATHQAGLFFHEAVYIYLRKKYLVSDSVAARNITACAMAETPCDELNASFGLPKNGPIFACRPTGWDYPADYLEKQAYIGAVPEFHVYPVRDGMWTQELEEHPQRAVGPTLQWRFQLTKLGGTPPPAKAYFDQQMQGFRLDEQGHLVSVFSEIPHTVRTVSSSDRWKNIGVSFAFQIGYRHQRNDRTITRGVTINGHVLKCHKVQ